MPKALQKIKSNGKIDIKSTVLSFAVPQNFFGYKATNKLTRA